MIVLKVIAVIFAILLFASMLLIIYEWIKYSGYFVKPPHTVSECKERIKTLEAQVEEHKNDSNLKITYQLQDDLDYWTDMLTRAENWEQKHKVS